MKYLLGHRSWAHAIVMKFWLFQMHEQIDFSRDYVVVDKGVGEQGIADMFNAEIAHVKSLYATI